MSCRQNNYSYNFKNRTRHACQAFAFIVERKFPDSCSIVKLLKNSLVSSPAGLLPVCCLMSDVYRQLSKLRRLCTAKYLRNSE
jgi:hypothetical protein